MKTTAQRIQEAMAIRNLKQVDLAERTGISKGALSSYISGKYIPKQNNIQLISKALNVSELWLNGYDVDMEDVITRISSPDTILFEITPRSLRSSPKIADVIVETVKEAFQNSQENNSITVLLNSNITLREKANILNSVIDHVLYNPLTNHVDIAFLFSERNNFERVLDMMICPIKSQALVCDFESLNTLGQSKAIENIKDLTYINMYRKNGDKNEIQNDV